jgi:hypothetical protein
MTAILTTGELAARWKMSTKSANRIMPNIIGAFRPGGRRGHWRAPLPAVEAYERGERTIVAPAKPRETSVATLLRRCPQRIQ